MKFRAASAREAKPGTPRGPAHDTAVDTGVPRYLTRTRATVTRRPASASGGEDAADRAAGAWVRGLPAAPSPAAIAPRAREATAARELVRQAGPGQRLDEDSATAARERLGVNPETVRIHTDRHAADVTRRLGANAATAGSHVFFAPGRHDPGSEQGARLLGHELAHVAQQGSEPRGVQCDLAQSLPVTLGVFEINMITQTTPPGLSGTVTFHPDPNGPYSAEIGLVQAVNGTDMSGTTATAGQPVDWNNMVDANTGVRGTEAGRMEQMTPGAPGGAPAGWMIDNLPSATPRGDSASPNYIEHFGIGGDNRYGWLRSPTDVGPASLFDFPSLSFDSDIDFETVAKGTDNQTVYGAISWGFQIRSAAVQNEYVSVQDTASPVFEEALERFRGYYVHEDVVLYFDTNQEIPIAGEETKLADIPDYLDRYPDVTVGVEGNADMRGSERLNRDLAQRRADAVSNLLLLEGVDASRIAYSFGFGRTDIFSEHGTAPGARQPRDEGRLRANRRVVITFAHNVSNHPIVMP